jgi:hypothetical protein
MPLEFDASTLARPPCTGGPPAYIRLVHVHAQRNLSGTEDLDHREESPPACHR